jgi:hypothetical protein
MEFIENKIDSESIEYIVGEDDFTKNMGACRINPCRFGWIFICFFLGLITYRVLFSDAPLTCLGYQIFDYIYHKLMDSNLVHYSLLLVHLAYEIVARTRY